MNRRDLIAGLAALATGTSMSLRTERATGELIKTEPVDFSRLPNNELRLLSDIDLDEHGNIVKTYVTIPCQTCDCL
jgi:hypothetical protein